MHSIPSSFWPNDTCAKEGGEAERIKNGQKEENIILPLGLAWDHISLKASIHAHPHWILNTCKNRKTIRAINKLIQLFRGNEGDWQKLRIFKTREANKKKCSANDCFLCWLAEMNLRPELAWTRVALGGSSCVQRFCLLVTKLGSVCVWERTMIHLDNCQYITSNGNKERWATWCRKRTQKNGCHFP